MVRTRGRRAARWCQAVRRPVRPSLQSASARTASAGRSGYRCNCWLGAMTAAGDRAYNDAVIYLESEELLAPGESAVVRIQPAFSDSWSSMTVGSLIEVCEGSR